MRGCDNGSRCATCPFPAADAAGWPSVGRRVRCVAVKAALVILHAEAARGGAERYTIDLARDLSAAGIDVALLASSFDDSPPPVERVVLRARALTRAGAYRAFLRSLEEHLREARYDIVHAMLPVPRCDIYHPHAGLAAETLAAGHLQHRSPLTRAAAWLGNRLNRRRCLYAAVERRLLAGDQAPLVLCLSDYVRRLVQRRYHLPPESLAVLHNGVDLQRFDPLPASAGSDAPPWPAAFADRGVVALMVAQDFRRKGLAEAIESLSLARDRRLRLAVVGRDDPRPYGRLARRRGVAEQVLFAPPAGDLRPFYRHADYLLLPTWHDPCSLVVLEALAMGLPVITTRRNGAAELMADGQHGRVLPDPSDGPALAAAMCAMLDPQRRAEMRRACLELRGRLSQSQHVERLIGIYRQRLAVRRGESFPPSQRAML